MLWYFEDDRQRNIVWLEQDVKWNAEQLTKLDEILQRQDEIRRELATQSLTLERIHDSFEGLETEHKWIVGVVHSAVLSIALELGKVSERQNSLPRGALDDRY